jgi:hypothetical protein
MTTSHKVLIGVVVALIAVTAAFLGGLAGRGSLIGASINHYEAGVWQFGNGLYAGLSQQFSLDNTGTITSDETVSGGTLTLTTSNTATSTAIIGCVQQYATSTATPWKFVIVASSTQMAPGHQGLVYADYGSCPNL